MAFNCKFSAQIPIHQKYGSIMKYGSNKFMSKRSYALQKKVGPVVLTITASIIKNKVYEDESEGIICYQDESGEIICEALDEGPSCRQISRSTHQPRNFMGLRDDEIMNLLRQRWLQINKGEEVDVAVEDDCLQEDLNYNKWF